jgi:hypothetical protein
METSLNELEKLSKQKLIEIIKNYQEKLVTLEECGNLLRIDARKF